MWFPPLGCPPLLRGELFGSLWAGEIRRKKSIGPWRLFLAVWRDCVGLPPSIARPTLMPKVLVGMSGGVDSSIAAALLKEKGWDVFGVTLKLLEREETGFGCCGSSQDISDAKRVCQQLSIPHYTLNLWEVFGREVVEPFVQEYLHARTPNPCVECNQKIKFGELFRL